MNKEYNNLDITKKNVEREILEARIYRNLLSNLIMGIRKSSFYNNHKEVFHYIEGTLETSYILALCKIFAKSKEESLWKLLDLVRQVEDKTFENRLRSFPHAPHEQLRQQREKILHNISSYIERIQEVEELLNPFRNTRRAHNFPLLIGKAREITYGQTEEWLDFAEEVFIAAMDGVCSSACRVGDFIPQELIYQMDSMVRTIKAVDSYERARNYNSGYGR
ncbi:MAG: hypothetical protein NUV91_01840 [Candidatus Omnitrophica bacterium]|nr:hypothetical protein [Candidatus Omnitrophota bacterium]